MKKTTESESNYKNLESMSTIDLLTSMNTEDKKVPEIISNILPSIEKLINASFKNISQGGRLFYIGAGTSGRLGIVDASECPPTFGIEHGVVIGIIAGGDKAIRKAVEFAEDSQNEGIQDLKNEAFNSLDTLIGIAASGTTPYVIGAIEYARQIGACTGCITCNEDSPLEKASQFPIVAKVGPEFVTGSTRMKAGTAQKLILNMISTSLMIKLGRVKGNKMVDMQLSNNKLVDRGIQMIIDELGIGSMEAKNLLSKYGSVRNVLKNYQNE